MTKLAVAMLRVSTAEQLNGGGESRQNDAILAYAKNAGLETAFTLFDDISGTKPLNERPEHKKILQLAKEGKITAVVFEDHERLARDVNVGLSIIQTLTKAGLEIHFAKTGSVITGTPNLVDIIMLWVAGEDRKKIVHRMTQGKRAKAKSGKIVNDYLTPLGYSSEGENITINEEEAKVVRFIFAQKAAGKSYDAIVRELNSKGITTKRGNKFTKSVISRIISTEWYIGKAYWGKTSVYQEGRDYINKYGVQMRRYARADKKDWVAFSVPQIIDNKTWDIVANQREVYANTLRNKMAYLLTGFIYCANDDVPLSGSGCSDRGKFYRYYKCSIRSNHPDKHCPSKSVRAEVLDSLIVGWLNQLSYDPDPVIQALIFERDHMEENLAPKRDQLSICNAQIAKIENQLSKLLDLYLDSAMTKDVLASKETDLKNILATLLESRAKLEAEINTNVTAHDIQSVEEALEFIKNQFSALREKLAGMPKEERVAAFMRLMDSSNPELMDIYKDMLRRLKAKIIVNYMGGKLRVEVYTILGVTNLNSSSTLRYAKLAVLE